jgi:hypothetical protein
VKTKWTCHLLAPIWGLAVHDRVRTPAPVTEPTAASESDKLDERGLIPADGHDSDTFDEAFYRHFEHPAVHDSAKKRLDMVGLLAQCRPGNVTSSLDVDSGTLRYRHTPAFP